MVAAHCDAASALVGSWRSERVLGPLVRGKITLMRTDWAWTAEVAGIGVPATIDGDSVNFTLPGDMGEFRGAFGERSGDIQGHWIQPARVLTEDRVATPLTLRQTVDSVWRGDIVPLDERLSLDLTVRQGPDGISATFTNPERNLWGRTTYRVSAGGDLQAGQSADAASAVRLFKRGSEQVDFRGKYDAEAGSLSLTAPEYGLAFNFTRFAGGPAARYSYRKPVVAGDDGWTTAGLDDVGIDPEPIRALIQAILDAEPGTGFPAVHSVLVARHGKLVLEEYFQGFCKERPHDLRSASKTYASIMTGIAIDRGAPLSSDTPVYGLFPCHRRLGAGDPRAGITLGHLLTMTSGLDGDDYDDASPGSEYRMQSQTLEPDWYRYTLALPAVRAPGEKYVYFSAGINLLGGILKNVTGSWLPDYFRRNVATPLQMRRYHINLMPTGDAYMGGGMHVRPRDALKLGQIGLSGGVWNGRRVVSRDWMEESTANHFDLGTGDSEGYMWHRHLLHSGGRDYPEYEANGNGGQFVMVFPGLDLTVGFTAGSYGDYGTWRKIRDELVPRFILPAIDGLP